MNANIPQLTRLHHLMNFALEHFRSCVVSGRELEKVFPNLITKNTLDLYRIGYSMDCWDLLKKTGHKGMDKFTYREMEGAGLLNYSVSKDGYYDVFRGRVMLPYLHQDTGQCVGFVGRQVIDDKSYPKNLYSRDISLFKYRDKIKVFSKEAFLFGLYQASKDIRQHSLAYVVPDYMDVIRLAEFGVTNMVSGTGIPFTFKQATLLKAYSVNVVLIYSGANAGMRAAIQHVDVFLAAGMNVKIVVLAIDLKETQNLKLLRRMLLDNQEDYVMFKIRTVLKRKDVDPVLFKKGLTSVIRTISFVPDKMTREIYLKQCAAVSLLSIESLRDALSSCDNRRQQVLESKRFKPGRIMNIIP